MMRRTLGASLGGTTRGGHQGVESLAVSLITPPNLGAGAGSCLPSTVVVALAEPNWPVTCWAAAVAMGSVETIRNTAKELVVVRVASANFRTPVTRFICSPCRACFICRVSFPYHAVG